MVLFKNTSTKIIFILFGITLVNIFQGKYTELISDEAYYWTYSNFLDWGYFDHPPMVAIWITISKFFFSTTEISVRFFSAISYSAALFLIYKIIENQRKKIHVGFFLLVTLSSVLLSVYGFITVPDTPLVFFVALFIYSYQKYLKTQNSTSYILLIIAIVGLFYSKYQAILIVFFVLLSNFKLLKDYKLWLSVLAIILLYLPHLYWQYIHNFVTFKYHLVDRTAKSDYIFSDTLLHVINCLAIIGPTFPLVYLAAFKNLQSKDNFNRGLNFIVIGFIFFFFLMTFKGHVQAQWVIPISIPLIVISYNYFIDTTRYFKLFKILASITIALIIVGRTIIIFDILPIKLDFHGNKKWVGAITKKLKNNSPLFLNSYQKTSLFWFYSGIRPYQYNSFWGRKNQYNLYNYNTSFTIDKGLAIGVFPDVASDTIIDKNKNKMYLREIRSVHINNNLDISYPDEVKLLENLNTIPVTVFAGDLKVDSIDKKPYVYFFNKKKKHLFSVEATIQVVNKKDMALNANRHILKFVLAKHPIVKEISYLKLALLPKEKLHTLGVGNLKKCIVASK